MKQNYWEKYYVVEGDATVIAGAIKRAIFVSDGENYELIYFKKNESAPNILISPGSAGHAYVFAELGYDMHLRGYNVFIMPKHGGYPVNALMERHKDALKYISSNFNDRIGVFAEGLGGYAVFYLALAHGPMKSAAYQNAPAILTEKAFQEALMKGKGSAKRRKMLLPVARPLLKVFPRITLPIRLYLDFAEMVDAKEENQRIEAPSIKRYLEDPDFDRWYALAAILSLVSTLPPYPLSELTVPTMFLLPVRGFYPSYEKDLFSRLPAIKKRLLEVDGGVFWMCAHPQEAAKLICERFDETREARRINQGVISGSRLRQAATKSGRRGEVLMNTLILLQLIWEHRKLRRRDGWTRQQLEAHQFSQLRLLREYAYTHSPFYRRFHQGFLDRPLQELPVLTKAMMMEHFDELVTDREIRREQVESHQAKMRGDERLLDRYWVNATSGSTGHPGLFLFNRSEWLTALASFARGYEWAGNRVNLTHRRKMAVVASTTPWHMSAQAGATLRSWWVPTLRLAASAPMESIIEHLNVWQPETLVSYASMARLLAGEQLEGRLQIAPQRIFTSSEVLTKESRRRIEEAWGKKLFNQYAATESGGLAAECEQHRGLHLFEDLVIFEVVDRDNRPVPAGVYGDKLLITVLFSRTQPLIRYELSDSLRLSGGACACGRAFTLIDDIQGRAEDVLWFPKPDGGRVAVQPITFHHVMELLPVSAWQIVQENDGLKVLLKGTHIGFSDEAVVEALRHVLREQGVMPSTIDVQHVEVIQRGAAGKAPLIRANRKPS